MIYQLVRNKNLIEFDRVFTGYHILSETVCLF